MFHDNKGQHRSCHQSSQDSQNNAHHVVVVDPHHCANIVDLPIDGDLPKHSLDPEKAIIISLTLLDSKVCEKYMAQNQKSLNLPP